MNDLSPVRALYEEARYLTAYQQSREHGPLTQWRGTKDRVLAGQLAMQLGAPRLGESLFLRAWRADPTSGLATSFAAMAQLRRRGPWGAWLLLRDPTKLLFDDGSEEADFFATGVSVLALLRDFHRAEEWLERALAIDPENSWLGVVRARLLEAEDRMDESLAVARQNVEKYPASRSSIETLAYALTLHNRMDEAVALLEEAAARLESFSIVLQLIQLRLEQQDFARIEAEIDRFEHLSPLREKMLQRWQKGGRLYMAARANDRPRLKELLEDSEDDESVKKIYERFLTSPPDAKRVELDVRFVRQHYQTCAPATLATISQFWSQPFEHLAIAEKICFDGTPAHSERKWAEQNGWEAREFTITEDAAVQLLDRGFPFTVTLVGSTHAHLCAAIGYDSRLGSILIRDPSKPQADEIGITKFLEGQRANGPRGMVLVPREKKELLQEVQLPDAELYDLLHEVQWGLEQHDRPRAEEALTKLIAMAPDHRLRWTAARALAAYDGDYERHLEAVDALLDSYPDEPQLRQLKLQSLRILSRFSQRRQLLDTYTADSDDPVYLRLLADEQIQDARQWTAAEKLLQRALRVNPYDPRTLFSLANLAWQRQEEEHAVDLFRFASCLEDKDPSLALSYFNVSQSFRGPEEAIALLVDRYRRFGDRSNQPAQTLFLAYEQLSRLDEAYAVLDEALTRRPTDGGLMLFAAEKLAAIGSMERAEKLLAKSRGRVPAYERRATWIRILQRRGDHKQALKLAADEAKRNRKSPYAVNTMGRVIIDAKGPTEGIAFLRRALRRHPQDYGLWQLLIECLRHAPGHLHQGAVRKLLALAPDDVWCIRELAISLARSGKQAESAALCKTAIELAPHDTSSLSLRGSTLVRAGDAAAAKGVFRKILQLDPDDRYALNALMSLCSRRVEQIELMEELHSRLMSPKCHGYAILSYGSVASGIVPKEELTEHLVELHHKRPEVWQSSSALVSHYRRIGQFETARQIAEEGTQRFAKLPIAWLDLANTAAATTDSKTQWSAAEKALALNPCCAMASCIQADLLMEQGKWTDAAAVMETAARRSPTDAMAHYQWGIALWRGGDHDRALSTMERAAKLGPGAEEVWRQLQDWCGRRNDLHRPLRLAREIVASGPGSTEAWLRLCATLPPYQINERLHAVAEALAIDPLLEHLYDLRAEILAINHRYDEAERACRPPLWGDAPPLTLRGRRAWLAAERGDVESAIEQMVEVANEFPDYLWGLQCLAHWYGYAGLEEEQRQIHERLGVLMGMPVTPQTDTSSDEVEKEAAEGNEATPPRPASLEDVDRQIEAGDLTAAKRKLGEIRYRIDAADADLRSIRILCREGEIDEALVCFEHLLNLPDVDQVTYEQAVAELANQKQLAKLRKLLRAKSMAENIGQRWAWSAVLDREIAALSEDSEGEETNEKKIERLHALARQMVDLWPSTPQANSYLAHAYLLRDEPAKATRHLIRVLKCDRSNQYAIRNLLETLLKTEDLTTASKVIRQLEGHVPAQFLLSWQVAIAARSGDSKAATDYFSQICTHEADDTESTRRAYDAMVSHKLTVPMLATMEASFDEEKVNPSIGALWVENRMASRGSRTVKRRLDRFRNNGLMGARAITAYLATMANVKQRRQLNRNVQRFRDTLSTYPECWGMVGAHLMDAQDFRTAEDWLFKQQHRHGAQPWMLYNLAMAQRYLKYPKLCRQIHVRALKMAPDNTTPMHQLHLAFEEAAAGKVEEAQGLLAGVFPQALNPWHQHVYYLTTACILAQSKDLDTPFSEIKRLVAMANQVASPNADRALHQLHRQGMNAIAGALGPASFGWYAVDAARNAAAMWSVVVGVVVAVFLQVLRVVLRD